MKAERQYRRRQLENSLQHPLWSLRVSFEEVARERERSSEAHGDRVITPSRMRQPEPIARSSLSHSFVPSSLPCIRSRKSTPVSPEKTGKTLSRNSRTRCEATELDLNFVRASLVSSKRRNASTTFSAPTANRAVSYALTLSRGEVAMTW